MPTQNQTPKQIASNPQEFARVFLKILNKEKVLVPFVWNRAQKHFYENMTGRDLILKSRQLGFSTLVQGEMFRRTVTSTQTTLTLAHDAETTQKLRRMADRFYDNCRFGDIRPLRHYANSTLATYPEFDSTSVIATAGNVETGRGDTYTMMHGCLSPETLVVSGENKKLTKMEDFRVGDTVITHNGNVAPVSFISKKQAESFRVLLRGVMDFPLVSTGEHRFLTKSGWRKLSELSIGDRIGYPVTKILNSNVAWSYRLPDSVRPRGGGSKEVGSEYLYPTYELGRVLGLYLAEGSVIKQSKYPYHVSAVSFAVHEKEVERTCAWLDCLSGNYTSYKVSPRKDSKTVTVVVYGRSFASFVINRCGELDDKHVPSDWSNCGEGFSTGLVHGYLSGDGHFSPSRDRRISATSIRSAISIGMRDIIASLGYGWSTISYKPAGFRGGRNEKEAWVLRLCGEGVERLSAEVGKPFVERKRTSINNPFSLRIENGFAWIPIVSIENIGSVEVMDFEVDHSDHSYCTVHGATHNSEAAFWKDAERIVDGAMQGGNPKVILESTPCGAQGFFYDKCMEALSGEGVWKIHFFQWWWDDAYKIESDEQITLTDDEKELAKTNNLTDAQIKWRRLKIKELGRLFTQEYPEDVIGCFLTSGNSYFGDMTGVFTANPDATWVEGNEYIAGLDFGQTDFTAMAVFNKKTQQQVDLLHINKMEWAEQRRRIKQTYDKWHLKSVLAEKNSIGAVNIEALTEIGVNAIPFETTNKSKTEIMSHMHELIHSGWKLLNNPIQKHEFNTFVSTQLPSGAWRLAADGDGHDDTVMACAIGLWQVGNDIKWIDGLGKVEGFKSKWSD